MMHCDVIQVTQHLTLKGFDDHHRQGDRAVFSEFYDREFFGEWDDGGVFETGAGD